MAAITQPITVSVFARQQRNAGTYTTTTAAVPEGATLLGVTDTMTDADASDVANSFLLTVQVSPDGAAWQGVFQYAFTGGTHFDKVTQTTVPNHIRTQWSDTRLSSGQWVNWQTRALLVQDVRMAVGLNATVYPAGFPVI